MRSHLEFKAPDFTEPDGSGNTYNPEIFGRKLAKFLSEQFSDLGYRGTIVEEDWGWMVELTSDPVHCWLGCSSHGDKDNWLVFIEPSKPAVRRWFSKIDVQPIVAEIGEKLENILIKKTGATNLQWWSDRDSGRK